MIGDFLQIPPCRSQGENSLNYTYCFETTSKTFSVFFLEIYLVIEILVPNSLSVKPVLKKILEAATQHRKKKGKQLLDSSTDTKVEVKNLNLATCIEVL